MFWDSPVFKIDSKILLEGQARNGRVERYTRT